MIRRAGSVRQWSCVIVVFVLLAGKAEIYGAEGKLDLPNWGRLSGYVSYSYQVGSVYLPVTGGLFLGVQGVNPNTQGTGRFWDSQDQRNTLGTRYRYQLTKRLWVGVGGEYGSGLPVEFEGTVLDRTSSGPMRVTDIILAP
jgi:hypothetical protein